MPRYLIVLSDDEGKDEDSTFVGKAFDEAVSSFAPGVWVVKTNSSAKKIAESLGIMAGGKRENWSSLVVPMDDFFGYMSVSFSKEIRALEDE